MALNKTSGFIFETYKILFFWISEVLHYFVTYLVTQTLLMAYCQIQMQVLLDLLHPLYQRAIKKKVGKWVILKYLFYTLYSQIQFLKCALKNVFILFNIEKCLQVNVYRKKWANLSEFEVIVRLMNYEWF